MFFHVPTNPKRRKMWLKLARRDPNSIVNNPKLFMCEDHFNVKKDIANYVQFKMGYSQRMLLAHTVVPSKFHCQEGPPREGSLRRQRKCIINECEEMFSKNVAKTLEKEDMLHETIDGDDEIEDVELQTPTLNDFDDAVGDEERHYYLEKFHDLKNVRRHRLHCTACNKHLGLLTRHINRYRMHPLLKTLVCISCQDFYNSGEFEKGEDGSELYCRWCGQGGQVYCCSRCPIVFCEKCINRNFGVSKINEIESNDDWLCFSCNPKPLWLLRAKFWVLIIYCTFKNNQAQNCSDPQQKTALLRKSQVDESDCCKKTIVRKPVTPIMDKRKQIEPKKAILDNRPPMPTADQKKTLSINEARQAIKRLGSPVSIKKVTIPSNPINSPSVGPVPLKMAIPNLQSSMQITAVKRMKLNTPAPPQIMSRFPVPSMIRPPERKIMPAPIKKPVPPSMFNGYSISQGLTPGMREAYNSVINNDNLNLSLDSLTQGIDLSNIAQLEAAAAALEAADNEPEEEEPPVTPVVNNVSKSNHRDDDVQCLTPTTPTPKVVPKLPTLAPRSFPASVPSSAFNNIIQMTENDVTINEVTGGLKFKVDPSTLSSSKMYKLPDGRIFAVNHNPNMPGGYSATIVAVDEASLRSGAPPPRGRVPPRLTPRQQAINNNKQQQQQTPPAKPPPQPINWGNKMTTRSKVQGTSGVTKSGLDPSTVSAGSVEWFKFNIVDAIDVMNYVLLKLNRIKNSSPDLRNKNVSEIKEMHQNFDQMLKTSCKRFSEVRDNLNTGFKTWLKERNCLELFSDDEDDIQILPDDNVSKSSGRSSRRGKISNNEPIYLDEDSNDSDKDDDVKETSASEDKDNTDKSIEKHTESKEEDTSKSADESKEDIENKEDVDNESKEDKEDANDENKDDDEDKEKVTNKEDGENKNIEDKEDIASKDVEDKEDGENKEDIENINDQNNCKELTETDKSIVEDSNKHANNNDTSHNTDDEEMQGGSINIDNTKDHSTEADEVLSDDSGIKPKEDQVVANGNCGLEDKEKELLEETNDDTKPNEDSVIESLLDDTNTTDKDVEMESDDLQNTLSNLDDSESRDIADEN